MIKGVVYKGLTSMSGLIGKPLQVRRRFICHATDSHTISHMLRTWTPFFFWGVG